MPRYLEHDRYVFECDVLACPARCETGEGRKPDAAKIARTKGWRIVQQTPPLSCRALCPDHKDI